MPELLPGESLWRCPNPRCLGVNDVAWEEGFGSRCECYDGHKSFDAPEPEEETE